MPGGISPAWKHVRIEDVHKPGNTLLWDLIQERAACRLPEGMFEEVEKNFAALIIAAPVTIKARFIEACIENVKNHTCVHHQPLLNPHECLSSQFIYHPIL